MSTTLPAFSWWFGGISGSDDNGSRSRRRNSGIDSIPAVVPTAASISFSDPDAALLTRVRSSDESDAQAAFETLFRNYYDTLTGSAYAILRSSDAARDVVADTFTKLWFARSNWAPAVTVRAYLLAAVRRRALNVTRDERRHADALWGAVQSPEHPESAVIGAIDDESQLAQVYAAIAAMRGVRREVMILRWQRAFGIPEIADALGISTNSVSAHLSQALRILKDTFNGR